METGQNVLLIYDRVCLLNKQLIVCIWRHFIYYVFIMYLSCRKIDNCFPIWWLNISMTTSIPKIFNKFSFLQISFRNSFIFEPRTIEYNSWMTSGTMPSTLHWKFISFKPVSERCKSFVKRCQKVGTHVSLNPLSTSHDTLQIYLALSTKEI